MRSRVFTGSTMHRRFGPRPHAFGYRLFWMSVELDELPLLDVVVRGFGHNRFALAAIHDRDYAGPGVGSIIEKLRPMLDRAGIARPTRVTLLTVPRILGYVFNPVSFYLLRRDDDALVGMVAEVRNTFGEMHHYVLAPEHAATVPGEFVQFVCAKRFYVSPFLDRRGEYHIRIRAPEDRLDLDIRLRQDDQTVFAADMRGSGATLTTGALWRAIARMPMHAASVMLMIHWQALVLRFVKKVPHYAKPGPLAGETAAAGPSSFWHLVRAALVARGRATHRETQSITPGTQTP